jgi:hypothetical protein
MCRVACARSKVPLREIELNRRSKDWRDQCITHFIKEIVHRCRVSLDWSSSSSNTFGALAHLMI